MNQLVVGGISLLVIGAVLISTLFESSWSIIVGVVLQGFGTFILQKGIAKKSKETVENSEKIVVKEINEFKEELQSAKNGINTSQKIAKIEQRFKEWANEFELSKNIKILELDRKEIEKKKMKNY